MPLFTVKYQTGAAELPVRRPRSLHSGEETLTLKATDFAQAAILAIQRVNLSVHRITAIEENAQWPTEPITDEDIVMALSVNAPAENQIHPEDWVDEDTALYESALFASTIADVANALRESELVPGLNVSLIDEPDGVSYLMVEIRDEATGRYHSVGAETKHMVESRELAGWSAIMSIARILIEKASPLM